MKQSHVCCVIKWSSYRIVDNRKRMIIFSKKIFHQFKLKPIRSDLHVTCKDFQYKYYNNDCRHYTFSKLKGLSNNQQLWFIFPLFRPNTDNEWFLLEPHRDVISPCPHSFLLIELSSPLLTLVLLYVYFSLFRRHLMTHRAHLYVWICWWSQLLACEM